MVIPQDSRAAALAPAAVALTLLVVMVQIRMDGPWSEGVLVLVALIAAVPAFALALAAPREARAERTALVVCALLAGGSFSSISSTAQAFELAEQGKLTVAFTGDMPGSGFSLNRMSISTLAPRAFL